MLFSKYADKVTVAEKLQKYLADANLQFSDLWKDVMKFDLKKIDPDARTAWEKFPPVFIRCLYQCMTQLSVLIQKGHITNSAFSTDPEGSHH